MATAFFDRNIPDECHQKISGFITAGDPPVCVAFAPGTDSWSVVAASGAFFNRNIPDECHQQMGELSKNGAKVICVAFPPAGGNSFSIVNDHGVFFNRNIPDECHQQMGELSKNGARIVWVAFPPVGGDSFSVVNSAGVFFNRNIPAECHTEMGTLSKNGAKVICVAFPHQGGNSWSVINNQGAFFNRNVPDVAHMEMTFLSDIYGPLQFVSFDPNGIGWSMVSHATKQETVCDSNNCVAIADVYRNISTRIDGKVVGYACCIGGAGLSYYSNGQARTAANAPAQPFLPQTKITVASVSKFVTALAAIRLLGKHNISLDSKIAGHLPSDWHLDPSVASITFRELLSHRSGIKDYGNVSMDYDTLKKFFTQTVDKTKSTKCTGPAVVNPPDPINPNDKSPCYSNYNFAIFRVMLPLINGFVDDPANRAAKLATAYVQICEANVFAPVGVSAMDAKPPSSGPEANAYSFAYNFPGSAAGQDWGDNTPIVGAAGWYLAIQDVAAVLNSLNKDDGRILTSAQLKDMESYPLGWDTVTDQNGRRWVEKNGGWSAGSGLVSTSVALYGPGLYGALFLNSDISGEKGVGADTVLHDAFVNATKPKV